MDDEAEEADDESEAGDVDTAQPDSAAEFIKAVDDYVSKCIKENADSNYSRTTLATDTVRTVEKLFLSSIPPNSCANCRGQSPKFRSEGMVKVFQKPLTAKQANAMSKRGLSLAKLNCHNSSGT